MKATKKARKKVLTSANREVVMRSFIEYVLNKGRRPTSIYKFCKINGISEQSFYKEFASLQTLEKEIWKNYVSLTVSKLKADKNYQNFSSQEKVLAFYFTLLESIRQDKEYIGIRAQKWKVTSLPPEFMKKFMKEFSSWINEVIEEGKLSQEIAKRPYLDKSYLSLFWLHLHFIIKFWLHDDSDEGEKTDAAIEKTVNLAFGIIGKGVLDNLLDFGKFMVQNARNQVS